MSAPATLRHAQLLDIERRRDRGDAISAEDARIECDALADLEATEEGRQVLADLAEPDPLRRPLPPPEPYPLDALGEILAPAANSIIETVQAPDAIIGSSLLAAASVAAMPHANVYIDGRRVPLSLWCLSIAESGERKSAVDELATRRHRMDERERRDQHEKDQRNYEIEVQAYGVIYKQEAKGKVIGEIKSKVQALGSPPEEPLLPWILSSDPTVEGLHKLLARGRGFGGLFSDDAGDFLGGYAMSKENRTRAAAALSKLWDRGEYDRVRGGDGASKHYGKRLALHLMAQPVVAESVLSDALLIGQGFLARCLFAWPQSRAGSRFYVERDLSNDPALVAYWQRIAQLLGRKPPLAEGTRNELEPKPLRLTPEAKSLWVQIANGIEEKMTAGAQLGDTKAWGSKGAEQILRVAGVLTLIADPDASEVVAATIEHAGELVAWYLGEAVRIIGTASVPAEIRHAEAILGWARERQFSKVHSRQLMQYGPGCVRTGDTLRRAMGVLVRHGYAGELEPGTVIDGRARRTAWRLRQ